MSKENEVTKPVEEKVRVYSLGFPKLTADEKLKALSEHAVIAKEKYNDEGIRISNLSFQDAKRILNVVGENREYTLTLIN